MSDNRYIEAGRTLSAKAKEAAAHARTKAIEQYWPTVERICREKVGPVALRMARDDAKAIAIARTIYPALPMAIRLLVREPEFIRFCLMNRDKLLLLAGEAGSGTSDNPGGGAGAV